MHVCSVWAGSGYVRERQCGLREWEFCTSHMHSLTSFTQWLLLFLAVCMHTRAVEWVSFGKVDIVVQSLI